MVILTEEEKQEMCIELADHLPKIRELLKLSQKAFGERCGISTPRMSVIENKHFVMTWSQLTSIMFVIVCNQKTKEYFFLLIVFLAQSFAVYTAKGRKQCALM